MNSKELGTASIFIIREIQQKQSWISDIYNENNQKPLSFVGSYSIYSNPNEVAKSILKTLQIDPFNYQTETPIKEWIDKAESRGIFISRTSFIHSKLKLDNEEIQGFTIVDKFAPFVFVNSDDWNAPQLFTLVHEIAHIWIAESGVSNEIEPELKNKDKLHPVELFCNEVAGNALMPKEVMDNLNKSTFTSNNEVFKISTKLGVSSFALLVRALNLNLISIDKYRGLKKKLRHIIMLFLRERKQRKLNKKNKVEDQALTYFV